MRSAGIDLRTTIGRTPGGWAGLQEIAVPELGDISERIATFEREIFDQVCRLVPTVHFLVRAEMTVPLRWLFVPIAAGAETSHTPTTVHSGLIVLIEDELTSSPYHSGQNDQQDTVLERLHGFLPILIQAAGIEEEHVRSEYILAQGQWAVQRDQFGWLQHLINTIRNSLTPSGECDAQYVQKLLETLQLSLVVLPERRQQSKQSQVAVPVLAAATEALDIFHAFYGRRKGAQATLIDRCPPGVSALITPLSQTHKNETADSQLQRASRDLRLLMLDLLCQRADAQEGEFSLLLTYNLSNRTVLLSIQLERPVPEQWIWDSTMPLDYWDKGRGFYLTFAVSQAMGSTMQVVENANKHGLIGLTFQSKYQDEL
jgi:hypothetical protein